MRLKMFRRRVNLPVDRTYFLALISGWEAGLATTTAIIAGTITGSDDRTIVLVSSLVALSVQGFNSALNHFEISHHEKEIDGNSEDRESVRIPLSEAGIQFGAHLFASIVVVAPVSIADNLGDALVYSVSLALGLMFITGLIIGLTLKHQPLRNAVTTMIVGGLVIIVGFIAGLVIQA